MGRKIAMLNMLDDIIRRHLPELLKDSNQWDSLIVNRRKPYTYRVFHQFSNDVRICLHKFDVCSATESFIHPHPWPGAFVVMYGCYRIQVGYSRDRVSPPESVTKLILSRFSMYEIDNPLTWHSVTPLEPTYTIMVNGIPWDKETVAHKEVRTTVGKDLDKMPEEDLKQHLQVFKSFCHDYNLQFKRIPKE
jgi:hypothetical protein